jgi:uncharacterized membrane protein YwzB
MSTFNDKIKISIGSGVLFAIMNIPQIQSFLGSTLFNSNTNCLTNYGIIIQVLIFAIITFFTMGKSSLDTLTKIGHTTYGSLIFFFVANPVTYKLISSLLGAWVSNSNGCPTIQGALLHTIVYIGILTGVMYFP